MLAAGSSTHGPRERVLLHVYELGTGTRLADAIKGLNAFTKGALNSGGVFHAAIEVENIGKSLEWSYGYAQQGSGVFAVKATTHPDHVFRETVVLGRTPLARDELLAVIRKMQVAWRGDAVRAPRPPPLPQHTPTAVARPAPARRACKRRRRGQRLVLQRGRGG